MVESLMGILKPLESIELLRVVVVVVAGIALLLPGGVFRFLELTSFAGWWVGVGEL